MEIENYVYSTSDSFLRLEMKQCYENLTKREATYLRAQLGGEVTLLDDILHGKPMPTLGRSIFFLETSCHKSYRDSFCNRELVQFNGFNLPMREACAIESAALHNPNSTVFLLFASPVYWHNLTANPTTEAILSYPNVQLRNVNMWTYAANTPIEGWFNTDKLFDSSFLVSHMSDFLRYLTLWHFGGTYLDTDVIVLRNLEGIPSNYAGAESKNFINSAVMNFGYDDIGRKVAYYCLQDFQRNFDGTNWGNNGPHVITRTLKNICKAEEVGDIINNTRCMGFQVYNQTAFYALPLRDWPHFFDDSKTELTLKRIENSFVVHLWNKKSQTLDARNNIHGAYVKLATKHCPKVLTSTKEHI